jgi:hypothetical protein
VKNPIRNETSLVLVVAVIFSAIAIPALSGFLEPSQPPAVAAVQVGNAQDSGGSDAVRDDGGPAKSREPASQPKPERESREPRSGNGDAKPGRAAQRRAAPAPSAEPAPAAPADDPVDDDGGGED